MICSEILKVKSQPLLVFYQWKSQNILGSISMRKFQLCKTAMFTFLNHRYLWNRIHATFHFVSNWCTYSRDSCLKVKCFKEFFDKFWNGMMANLHNLGSFFQAMKRTNIIKTVLLVNLPRRACFLLKYFIIRCWNSEFLIFWEFAIIPFLTEDWGGKYLVFVSSRSVKMRGFSCLSLHAFWGKCVYFSNF